ncbi:MAG: response regulator transcription factor [Eubacterium sp.]|nr:response regulator transcription factor [Eubacterium sp.]
MRTVTANNWSVLNNIIYKIYTTEDAKQMRVSFLEQLKLVLDFDSAEFYLTDLIDSQRFVKPVQYDCDVNGGKLFREMLKKSTVTFQGKSIVLKGTDLVSSEERVSMPFYKEYFVPNNWEYSMHLVLGDKATCFGLISFYRTIGKDNFDTDDIYVLELMKDHLLYRLGEERIERAAIQEKLTVTEATEHYNLTKRESAILRRLMQGQNNNQISEELQISVNTLKKHVLNIYRKLNINNRVQLFKAIKEKEK